MLGPASNAIHGYINDFLVCAKLAGGIGDSDLPCLTTLLAEVR